MISSKASIGPQARRGKKATPNNSPQALRESSTSHEKRLRFILILARALGPPLSPRQTCAESQTFVRRGFHSSGATSAHFRQRGLMSLMQTTATKGLDLVSFLGFGGFSRIFVALGKYSTSCQATMDLDIEGFLGFECFLRVFAALGRLFTSFP